MGREPASREAVQRAVEANLRKLSAAKRGLFEQMRVPIHQVEVARLQCLETLWVVASARDRVVVFDDVEDGFQFAELGDRGVWSQRGSGQYGLAHIVSIELESIVGGCLIGGALGDALGADYEGTVGDRFDRPPDLCGRRVSDDTQLTLATCEALANVGRVDPEAISSTFLAWFGDRRLSGLGASTLHALRGLEAGGHWALVGRRGEHAAGNGAAMRAAPLAFALDPSDASDRVLLRDVCRITHHSDEAYVGALAVVLAVRRVASVGREGLDGLLSAIAAMLPDSLVRDRLLEYSRLDRRVAIGRLAAERGCSGWVVESVPLALFAAQAGREAGFEAVLVDVVRCGGDADTNASIAGQVLGAALGSDRLPTKLVGSLHELSELERSCSRYLAWLLQSEGASWWQRVLGGN